MLEGAVVTVAGMRCWRRSVVDLHATAGAWWSTGGVGCWSGDVATDGDEGGRRMLGEEATGAGGSGGGGGPCLLMLAHDLFCSRADSTPAGIVISPRSKATLKAGLLLTTPALKQSSLHRLERAHKESPLSIDCRLCAHKIARFHLDRRASCGTRADCCPFHSRQPQRLDFVLAWGPLSRIGVLQVLLFARLASSTLLICSLSRERTPAKYFAYACAPRRHSFDRVDCPSWTTRKLTPP